MRPELEKKVQSAIHLIQAASEMAKKVNQVICVSFSGGKDSACILELVKMACVPYQSIYHNTTIDPPGTIKYCKDNNVKVLRPKRSFLELIKYAGFPNRYYRFCCSQLKEIKMDNYDYVVLGIRADESTKRKERYKEPEQCRIFTKTKKERQYFPILDWNLQDVEEFIIERGIRLHPLYYDENGNIDVTKRLGCIGCPLQSSKNRIAQFKKYPNLIKLYAIGGECFLDNHPLSKNHKRFKDVYQWLVCELFCDLSYHKFQEKFGKNLFDDGMDCKKFLEDYFNIKFLT